MSRDLISCICLTTWPKRAEMLTESLRAYSLQKYTPRRLFLINDGLPLRSLAPDVTVENLRSGLTIGEKRDRGLWLAGDSWASTWDDDDFALPETLQFLMRTAYRRTYEYVCSALYAIANASMQIGCIVRQPVLGSCVFWAPAARRLGGYPAINNGEDGAMHTKLIQSVPHGLQDRLTYVYRRHRKNITIGQPWGDRTDRRLTDCMEDQEHWPRLEIQELQEYLDYCRNTVTPDLVEPVEQGLAHALPSHAP
jgi:PAS domain-containing protein